VPSSPEKSDGAALIKESNSLNVTVEEVNETNFLKVVNREPSGFELERDNKENSESKQSFFESLKGVFRKNFFGASTTSEKKAQLDTSANAEVQDSVIIEQESGEKKSGTQQKRTQRQQSFTLNSLEADDITIKLRQNNKASADGPATGNSETPDNMN